VVLQQGFLILGFLVLGLLVKFQCRPASRPIFEDALVSDEPNKLASEAAIQAESAAIAAEQPVEDVAEAAAIEMAEAELTAGEAITCEAEEVASAKEEPIEENEANQEFPEADDTEADDTEADDTEADDTEAESSDSGVEVGAEPDSDDEIKKDWYILKVQSNREKSIMAALKRKIAVEGLDDFFGDVIVPMEKVTEFKSGKKKIVERKLYPGYIVIHMHINDDTWFAVRETSGIGDFTGSGGKPTPMLPHEVARIIQSDDEEVEESPKLNISFKIGDRVKVKEGTFESFEGEVNSIDEHSGRVTVMINIFGRSTPVELEYWQAEQI